MTIINIWVGESRILVGADELASFLDSSGPPHLTGKLLPLPHARSLLTMTGDYMFMPLLAISALQVRNADFDSLDEALPGYIAQHWQHLQTLPQLPGIAGREQRVFLCGWSATRNRMLVARYRKLPTEADWQRSEIGEAGSTEHYSSRWDDDIHGAVPDMSTVARMRAVACAQYRHARSLQTGTVGGDFIVAEMTRDTITITRTGDLAGGPSISGP